ncbi:MAG: FxsA family protein [Alphaproteobacteria bacterium]|nr:FxsA family protein [Alphaproteobacteria bacterium]
MAAYLFLGFLIVPMIEIGLFILLGQAIGLWPTLLGVVVTAVIGSAIIRSQGLSLIADIQRHMQSGRLPAMQLFEGLLVGIAGALLLTPGYFTDTIGFLLLVPPLRQALYAFLKTRIRVDGFTSGPGHEPRSRRDGIVDLKDDDWRDR